MSSAPDLQPGFMVVHGNRLDELRGLAVAWMRRYPLHPLENEAVLVHSNGIAQWLRLALAEDPGTEGSAAGGCGIAAALDVQLPSAFLWRIYRQILGADSIPRRSALDKAPMTWRLMRLLPELLPQAHFQPLSRFLADDRDSRKLYQLAERLADLFDQYQVYRADWLQAWQQGQDELLLARGDIQPLRDEHRWQAELWRALLQDVGQTAFEESRASVHSRFIARMKSLQQPPPGLVRRIVVFGISSMPAQALEALAVLARFSQVLLCVHNPCRHHWADIVPDKELLRHEFRRHPRKAGMPVDAPGELLHQHVQPLLASWGKQARDYISLLDRFDEPDRYRGLFDGVDSGRIDLFDEEEQPRHLLGQLQNDILELRPLEETRQQWPVVSPGHDRSIRFHIAHSPQREVEILHDQLLARFGHDSTLRPRDVIVMVPDINTYIPHIQAVFGQLERSDPRFIPFTLSDQGQRGRDPLLVALEHLLNLPESRFAVSEILDLLDVPALRRRFSIDDPDLPLLHRWIEGAGIRWGLDARQREDFGVPPGVDQNTWHFGLKRMLLGYAVGEGEAFADIEPYAEIGGLDAALLGPLEDLLGCLELARRELSLPASPAQWAERLRALLELFFLPQSEADQVLHSQLLQLLDVWLEDCRGAGLDLPLPLAVVREAWLSGLDQGNLSKRFLAGAVNFCTLMPMRAIPFKVVCLLGMGDADYPRPQSPLDFDLMRLDYRPGDRSRREDDRYLLLEALLSAREQLYVSWTGRSIRDNSERPASVLIGQLRDHLAAGWTLEGHPDDGEALLDALTCVHPLQPFNVAYFQRDSGLFSYAQEWLALHQPAESEAQQAELEVFVRDEPLSLEQLQDFLRQPARHFFRQRLKVFFEELDEPLADEESFALDALQRYQLADRLLRAAVQSDIPEQGLQEQADSLQRSGELPLAGFGQLQRQALLQPLPAVLQHYRQLLEEWPERLDSPLALHFERPGLTEVSGWMGGLRRRADGELMNILIQPGALGQGTKRRWHHLIRPWVAHVLASALGAPLHTALVGNDLTLRLAPLPGDQARDYLQAMLQAWAAHMSKPLPLAPRTALAWLAAVPEKAAEIARRTYQGDGFGQVGELAREQDLQRLFPDYERLVADEDHAGWWHSLYGPLLQAEWQEQEREEHA